MNEQLRAIVELTRELILIPSTKERPDDIRRGLDFIRYHLDHLNDIEIVQYESGGSPSLLCLPGGRLDPHVLLLGHLDVIVLPDGTRYSPHIEKGRIYGPGAADMKGALAVLIERFRTLHENNPGISLGLAVTSDEEIGGRDGTRYLFHEKSVSPGLVLLPDSGFLNKVTVAEKGLLHARLTAHGIPGHASRPWEASNALETLLEILTAVRRHFKTLAGDDNWHPTCAVTGIEVPHAATNRIPAKAEAILDIRFPSPWTASRIFNEILQFFDSNAELSEIISGDPTEYAPNKNYMEITEQITGKSVATYRAHGGTDGRFIASLGIPVVMSSPTIGNVHTAKEWVEIESLEKLSQIYSEFIGLTLQLNNIENR